MKPLQMPLLAAMLAVVLACPLPAAAQWAWRDAAGRMVFSDQPPPRSIPSKDIVRQPGPGALRPAPPAAEQDTPPDSRAPAQAAAPTVADREIEARRRQLEQAEATKKAADEEARTAQLAENCERLRAYQRALEGGFRVARVNADGQQEFLDDAARAAETERTRALLEQSCR